MSSTAGQVKCDSKLEIAILQYFKSFRKVYMMDSANGPSMGMTVPGGTYVLHCALLCCSALPIAVYCYACNVQIHFYLSSNLHYR
jgi:hypothetical protein